MGLMLSEGWKMASLVTITGSVLVGLNVRELTSTEPTAMLALSAATALGITVLGLRLLLDIDRSDG